jgi:hypothetical protein
LKCIKLGSLVTISTSTMTATSTTDTSRWHIIIHNNEHWFFHIVLT